MLGGSNRARAGRRIAEADRLVQTVDLRTDKKALVDEPPVAPVLTARHRNASALSSVLRADRVRNLLSAADGDQDDAGDGRAVGTLDDDARAGAFLGALDL